MIRLRAGLYDLEQTHKDCGGELRAEKVSSGQFRWETYCRKCKDCDPNGYATLVECKENILKE